MSKRRQESVSTNDSLTGSYPGSYKPFRGLDEDSNHTCNADFLRNDRDRARFYSESELQSERYQIFREQLETPSGSSHSCHSGTENGAVSDEDQDGSELDEKSDEFLRQVTCMSDKTMDRSYCWSSFPEISYSRNHRHHRRLRFKQQCSGCNDYINYSKKRFSSAFLTGVKQSKRGLPDLGAVKHPTHFAKPEETKKSWTKQQKWILFCVALADFSSFLSMSIIAPFFPKEASAKGMPVSVSGFVFSIYALVVMLTSPLFGKILPHVGTRFLFLSGIAVAGCSNILFGLLDRIADELTFCIFCFVVRIFEALGAAAMTTASNTIILNEFPDDIGTVFGLVETCVGIGMSIGPAVGGGLYAIGGYGLPFFILGCFVLVCSFFSWCCLHTYEDLDDTLKCKTSFKKLLSIPQVLIICVVLIVASQAQGFVDPTLEPHLRQFNLGAEIVGLLFLLLSASYGVTAPLIGWIAGKMDNKYPLMVFGLLLMTLSLLILGPSPFLPLDGSQLWLNIVAIIMLGVSFAMSFVPTFEALLISALGGGMRDNLGTYSIVSGLWTSMYSLGDVTGPSLGGVLLEVLDFPLAATSMAICSALTAMLAAVASVVYGKKSTNKVPLDSSDSDDASDCSTAEAQSNEHTPLLKPPKIGDNSQDKYVVTRIECSSPDGKKPEIIIKQ